MSGDFFPVIRGHGYRTGFVGKFRVGDEAALKAVSGDFDYWRGILDHWGNDFIEPNDPSRTHATARFGDQALEFLRDQAVDRPFCPSVSFTAPHARDHMPREYTPDDRDEPLYADIGLPKPLTAPDAYFEKLP